MNTYDFVIIGAGIIGCSFAKLLSERSDKRILVVDKEKSVAYHTSSRNSGVLHSGFNQKPGTLKAMFCVEGNRRLQNYCKEKGLDIIRCGTVVLAKKQSEIKVLEELEKRGRLNGVEGIKIITKNEIKNLEPSAKGIAALYSPNGCIVNSKQITESFARDAMSNGVKFLFAASVSSIHKGKEIRLTGDFGEILAKFVINCAGLQADRIARMFGLAENYMIVPFIGKYYKVTSQKREIVRSMIYPVPNLDYPFLGVHLTRTVYGDLIAGPNASLALGREAYGRFEFNLRDLFDTFTFMGSIRAFFNSKFRNFLVEEQITSLVKSEFYERISSLVENISIDDLVEDGSGIRAQLVDISGKLVDDFLVLYDNESIHILNAVSPGLTSSLPFAEYVLGKAIDQGVIQV